MQLPLQSSTTGSSQSGPTRPFGTQRVDPNPRAAIGRTVEVEFIDGQVERFVLVAEGQRNPGTDEISVESPAGHALLGAVAGQRVAYKVGTQVMRCRVVSVY
jgi:transcription elongation GreA/GreB family factor